MEIINTHHRIGSSQWIEGFVSDVLADANFNCERAIILFIGVNEVNLLIDGDTYAILMNKIVATKKDHNRMTCGEDIEYLFGKQQRDDSNSDPTYLFTSLASGTVSIEWSNDPKFFRTDFMGDYFYYDDPNELNSIQTCKELDVGIELVDYSEFSFPYDIQDLTPEDRAAVASCFVESNGDKSTSTRNSTIFFNTIHCICANIVTNRCIYNKCFDLHYSRWLLLSCYANNLCSLKCAIDLERNLTRLYEKGSSAALNSIHNRLYQFFAETKPYTIGIYAE